MTSADIAALNARFARDNRLQFSAGKGGLTKVDITFQEARLELYLQGAHITRYQPLAGVDLLWMSDSAVYQPAKALRGGIPLCWPWFGADSVDADRPQHGYARTSDFSVVSTLADDQASSITLALGPAQLTFPDWHNKLRLEFEIRLSAALWMEMRSHNLSNSPLILSNALHSYLRISSRSQVAIPAVTGLTYLDKLQDYLPRRQLTAITLNSEVDRVYQAPPATIDLLDSARGSKTSIRSWGNNNLVIWNPGAQKALAMADFDDDGFERMVCLEPANALQQSITLQPDERHRLGQVITTGAQRGPGV
jgi:glucose-6-phosphate 1-epimerase